MNPFRILFHKNSVYIWCVLLGGGIGFMLGRSQDPLDRAIRRAQNEAKPVVTTSLRRGGVISMDEQLRADPAKRAAYAAEVSNNMVRKEKAVKVLDDVRAYMDLALQRNFIDNSLHQYLAALGDIQMRHGFLYQAVSNLERAVDINPYNAAGIYNLAMSYLGLYQVMGNSSEKNTLGDKAVAALNMGLAVSPDDSDLMYGLALIYTDRGSFARALPLFSRMLEKDASNIDALMGAGRIYYEQKEYDKSRQIYERAEALLLNRRNSGQRFLQTNPERRLETVRRNLETLHKLTGVR